MIKDIVYKNILWPTDFSELAGNAMITAIEMCKRHNATLHILHVVENQLTAVPREARVPVFYLLPDMENAGREKLLALTETIKNKHKIKVKTHLDFGIPAFAIRDKAIDIKSELIIVGTHGASGFRELFIGTTAYALIRNTTIPVLTIPGKKKVKAFNKILFPIRAAAGLLEKYDFIKPIIQSNNSELLILGLSLRSEIFNIDDRKKELLQLGKSLAKNMTTYKSEFCVCNNYAKKVLERARKQKVDLIVINATLDYNWSDFFVGPYTQQIVNHASIPVLSIRVAGSSNAQNKVLPKSKTKAVA